MRTGMSWWSDERIAWYEKAAGCSSFHHSLVSALERHLLIGSPVLELGCGLGYCAQLLHGDGYSIKATDIDRNALRRASERTGLDIFSYLDADGPIPYTDQLLMVFSGHIGSAAELDGYLSRCRRMAMVISHHRGQGCQTRESRRALLLGILREAGCAYDEEELALSFDQPLDSREDAMAFVRTCYPAECQERVLSMVEEGTASPYILRNRKMMSIFTIYGKEGR